MNDLIIITDKPITYESIANLLKEEFKDFPEVSGNKIDFFSVYNEKTKAGFEMDFSPNDILSDPDSWMDESIAIEKCPNKKAYLTNVGYRDLSLVKRLIKLIINNYGSMWIETDETNAWFGTAQEFIDNYEEEKWWLK